MLSAFTFPQISGYHYIAEGEGSGEWFHIPCTSFSGDFVARVTHKLYETAVGAKEIQSGLTNPSHCLWWFERLHNLSTVIHSDVTLSVTLKESGCVCRSLRQLFSLTSSKTVNKVRRVSGSVWDQYSSMDKVLSFILSMENKMRY